MARLQGGRDAVESGFWGQIGRSDGSLFGPIWPSGIFTGNDVLKSVQNFDLSLTRMPQTKITCDRGFLCRVLERILEAKHSSFS